MSNQQQEQIAIKGKEKVQIAKYLYWKHKQSMKEILRMGEFKYGSRKSDGYKHYRKKVMETFYSQLNQIFGLYEEIGLIQRCGCGHTLDSRDGYQPCQNCAGCGYRNSGYLNDAMAYFEGWSPNPQEMIRQMVEEESQKRGISIQEYLYPEKKAELVTV